MAHDITKDDGLVLYGKPAWHGLGVVVDKAPSPAEALQIAGLDWSVEECPLFTERDLVTVGPDGIGQERKRLDVKSHKANVRSDTGRVLGVVGSDYHVVQNRDLVPLIYDAARSEGVTIESAGSLRGGQTVFFLAHLGTFNVGERDTSHTFALFTNAHDGTGALRVLPTSVRVVCRNTLNLAARGAEASRLVVHLRHTSGLAARLDDVRACLRGASAVAAREADKARALAAVTLTPAAVESLFAAVYVRLYGPIPSAKEANDRGTKGKRTRALEALGAWASTLRTESDALGLAPSPWLVANAATRWIDHDRTTRGGDRLASNLIGSAASAKRDVFAVAEEAAGIA